MIGAAMFLWFGANSSASAQELTPEQSAMFDHFINIAKHGELRDVAFVEKEFGVKFSVDIDKSPTNKIYGIDSVVAVNLVPDKNPFPGTKFAYWLYVNGTCQGSCAKTDVAEILIRQSDNFFCITPDMMQKKLGSNKPDDVLYGGAIPPSLPPISYGFHLKGTASYTVEVGVVHIDSRKRCVESIGVTQVTKPKHLLNKNDGENK